MACPVSLFIHWAYRKKKKMWPSSLFTASILIIIISTHSLYEKGGVFFFQILILYDHAYLDIRLISLASEQGLIPFLAPFDGGASVLD